MEYINFEAQFFNEMLMFEETSNFWYTDQPEKPAIILQSGFWDADQGTFSKM